MYTIYVDILGVLDDRCFSNHLEDLTLILIKPTLVLFKRCL